MKRDENQSVEYKESWHDKYLEWICGYANAKGGTLYIGIEDKTKREDSISECDRSGDARIFVEFMLKALRDALAEVKRGVGKGVVKSVVKILDLLKQYPDITRERLAREVGLSVRGVEKNLAQLKSAGKIIRVGGRKGGHWEVVGFKP